MKVLRKFVVAVLCSVGLVAGVVAPAHAVTMGRYITCAGLPAHVASMGYQNTPSDLLYVYAASVSQVRINDYTLTVTAPGVHNGRAGASSKSLNVSRSAQYCNPNN